jgi:DNA-binding MarR family transcriptional regulator
MKTGIIITELNEIKSSISEIKINTKSAKNSISNDYELIIFLEKYIKNRKLRNISIDSTLFMNPSWDILVELCYARLVRKPEYVSSIVTAGGSPPTTGLRHLSRLHKLGYIERENQLHDRRRVMVKISDSAFNSMKEFFVRASRAE